jgi:hypothetical protein
MRMLIGRAALGRTVAHLQPRSSQSAQSTIVSAIGAFAAVTVGYRSRASSADTLSMSLAYCPRGAVCTNRVRYRRAASI